MGELAVLLFSGLFELLLLPVLKVTGIAVVYVITLGQREVDDGAAYAFGAIVWISILAVALGLAFRH